MRKLIKILVVFLVFLQLNFVFAQNPIQIKYDVTNNEEFSVPVWKDSLVRIAVYDNYPPYQYLNEKGDLDGFTINIVAQIMKELGCAYEFVICNNPTKGMELLKKGDVHLMTVQNSSYVDDSTLIYTNTYVEGQLAYYVTENSILKSIKELRNKRLFFPNYLQKNFAHLQFALNEKELVLKSTKELIDDLLSGKCDAILANTQTVTFYTTKKSYKHSPRILSYLLTGESFHRFCCIKKNELLQQEINKEIFKIKSSGLYYDLSKSFFFKSWNEKVSERIFLLLFLSVIIVFIAFVIFAIQYKKMKKEKKTEAKEIRFFQALLEYIPIPIYVSNYNGRNIYWNNSAYKSYGDGKGDKLNEIIDERQINKTKKINNRVFATGKSYKGYERITLLNGVTHETSIYKTLIRKGKEEMLFTTRMIIDDLVEAQKKAKQSENLKSAFLANISHEIRTPLNAISGFATLLTDASEDEDIESYVSIIHHNSELLLHLIKDIVDLSNYDSDILNRNIEEIDFLSFINEIKMLYKQILIEQGKHEKIELFFDIPYRRFVGKIDRNLFYQVLTNILNNAIKYTFDGFIRFGLFCYQGYTFFYVKDSGIGIAKEKLVKVFTRFGKLDNVAEGNGLGMAISKNIMKSLFGDLFVFSKEHVGSTFWGYLPVEKEVEEDPSFKHEIMNDIQGEILNHFNQVLKKNKEE